MSKLLKLSYLLLMFGVVIVVSGCGGDARVETNPSATAPIASTLNSDGTATTDANITTITTPAGTPGYLAGVSVTLPPGTTITAKNADGSTKALTEPPSFTFIAPVDSSAAFAGTKGVPVPTGFTSLASVSGAVDVQLTGSASAIFNPPITITMPVPGEAVGSVIAVYTVAGTTYASLGSYTVTTAGFVSFPVTSLSWKVGNPIPDTSVPTTVATTVPGTTVATTVPGTTVATTVPGTTVATTVPGTTVATTVPGTTVATTVPGTTVATTVPGTTVATTVPGTTIGTTIPATTIATTVPATTVATTTTTTAPTTTVATTVATTVPPTLDGAALYAGSCQGCHGPLATPSRRIRSKTVAGIRSAGMAWGLTDAELTAIIAVLP
jgi:hypothetical protein